MKQDITSYNEKGQPHGYWEYYYSNGELDFKGNYVNGKREGYWEEYYDDGQLFFKGNYVNGKQDGYFLEYLDNSYYKFFYKNGSRYYKNRYIVKLLNFKIYKIR